MDWWVVVLIAYGVTGLLRVALEYQAIIGLWKNFHEHLGKHLSSLQVEQMSEDEFNTQRLTNVIVAILALWLFWPIVKTE